MSFSICVAAVVLVAACGPRFTNENIDVVNKEFEAGEKVGKGAVSPKEVESILGQPTHVEHYILTLETQKKELQGTRYYYHQDGQKIELHFLDNKLISRVPLLDSKAATPPSKAEP